MMNLLTLLSKYYCELYKNGVQVKFPEEKSRFYISYSLSRTTNNCCEPNIFRFLSITHTIFATSIHYAMPLLGRRTFLPKGGCSIFHDMYQPTELRLQNLIKAFFAIKINNDFFCYIEPQLRT